VQQTEGGDRRNLRGYAWRNSLRVEIVVILGTQSLQTKILWYNKVDRMFFENLGPTGIDW